MTHFYIVSYCIAVIIPPTYEVCEVYIFCFSIHQFVRTFVCSFVFPSQGQSFCVKVYKTSYFEDSLMDFIHIWYDVRSKVFISTIPTPGVPWGQGHRIFVKKSKFFVFKFI